MKESANQSFSQLQYEQIIGQCALQNSQNFAHLNMAAEIANTVLLMLLNQGQTDGFSSLIQDNVQALYPKAVEDVFASFQRKIFQSCFAKTRDPEISHDIAQETILQLLGSQAEIKNVPAWMNSVSHNLLCQHYEAKAGDSTIYEELVKQDQSIQNAMNDTDSILIDGLDPTLQKEILQSPEYQEYESMNACKSMAEYASVLDVSPKVAQKRKDKIVRNLKSKILLAMGWENSPDILDYYQYDAILRFIRNMFKLGTQKVEDRNNSKSPKYDPKLVELMQEMASIDDWGIILLGDHRYSIYLFHLNQENKPVVVSFTIHLNEKNHLSIEDGRRNKVFGSFAMPANLQIPKEMGKSLWTFEEIISRLQQ